MAISQVMIFMGIPPLVGYPPERISRDRHVTSRQARSWASAIAVVYRGRPDL